MPNLPNFVALLLTALVMLSGCRPNPLRCDDHVLHNCELPPDMVDGQQGCISNDQCTPPTAVCNVSTTVCVQCTSDQAAACKGATAVCSAANTCVQCTAAQPGACIATTPICNVDSNQCEKCTAHAQCVASGVCLADGSCASQGDVAYVAPAPAGTDNTTCTKANPCISPSKALQTQRRYIRFSGATDEAVSIADQDVALIGEPNAQLTSTRNGLLLEIRGSSHVVVDQLVVTGASGTAGIGITLQVGSTGSLTISRSTISNNQGGGVSILGGTFAVVGNVFYNNGGINTSIGGIAISTPQNPANRLEFNTFSRNQVQDGLGAAIQCAAGAMFTARNNIMSENGTLTNAEQVGGSCKHAYSIARPGTPLPPAQNNTSSDPAFVDAAKGDLHIQPGSLARHAADPTSDLTGIASQDIDGDPRVAPADIGADQVK